MRHRSIVLLTGGLLALALAPPVLGAGGATGPSPDQMGPTTSSSAYSASPSPAPAPSSTTSTTAADPGAADPADPGTGTPPPSDSTGACAAPVQTQEPAPAEGESAVYPANEAGEVEVSRISATELEVVDAVANDGWTAEVTTPTGPRVKVRFVEDATGGKTRFAASMDDHGQEIHVRVESCS